jgi:hypothetical protein
MCLEAFRKLRFPDYVSITQNGGKVVNQSHYRAEVPRVFQEVKVPRLCDSITEWL